MIGMPISVQSLSDSVDAMGALTRLNPPQQEIDDLGLLCSGFSVILQLPTGSGKTWLAEQAIGDVLGRGQRAIYLTPLRALGPRRIGANP